MDAHQSMNVRGHETVGAATRAALGEWLDQNSASAAHRVVAALYAARPELREQYGANGRVKCEEDVRYHLYFLKEAILTNSPKAFEQYVAWAKITLMSRGIDFNDFAETLALIPEAVGKKVSPAQQSLLRSFLSTTLKMLPKMPSEVPSMINGDGPRAELANKYLSSLLVMNRKEAIEAVFTCVDEGMTIRDLFEHVIAPVQRETGRLWQQNSISVLQEHYITASTELLIARVQGRYTWNRKESHQAICVCAPGEHHCVGLQMFSELLEIEGWNSLFIGANTPSNSVIDHIEKVPTDILVISATVLMNLASVRQLIKAVRKLPTPPKILLGGGLVRTEPEACHTLDADAFAANLQDGVIAANRLVREKTRIKTS